MPVYFFNVRQGDRLGVDEAGIDLPDLEAVLLYATELAREIMCDDILGGEVALNRSVEVTDRTGATVLVLPFNAVVEVKPSASEEATSDPCVGFDTVPPRKKPPRAY